MIRLFRIGDWSLWLHSFLLGPCHTSESKSWYFGWLSLSKYKLESSVLERTDAELVARIARLRKEIAS